jgi:hypothetical protein
MPNARKATATRGERFSSSRSFTLTWPSDVRIRPREDPREAYVVHREVRIVFAYLVGRDPTLEQCGHASDREAASGKRGFAAQDVGGNGEAVLPAQEAVDAGLEFTEQTRDRDRRAGLRELSRMTQEFGGYDSETGA